MRDWRTEVFDWLGFKRKPLIERWADKFLEAFERAAGSLERTTGRAAEAAGSARRRTGTQLHEARERARSGRDALAERVDAISRRAAEIRERRAERRDARREAQVSARAGLRAERRLPMHMDLRRKDRIVLRGRRPVNVRLPDGGLIRYRYYDRPGFLRRFFLHLTGRQIWPRR